MNFSSFSLPSSGLHALNCLLCSSLSFSALRIWVTGKNVCLQSYLRVSAAESDLSSRCQMSSIIAVSLLAVFGLLLLLHPTCCLLGLLYPAFDDALVLVDT